MNQTNLKNPARISLAAMAVLCIGALVFYRERLFADTSFSAFNIINNKNFYIENQRYGSFIPQLLPYIGTQLHLSLKIILIGYVLSSNLFYLLIAALLVYRYRQYGLAVCMGLYYFLFVSDSFFMANADINQAVAWMFLMFGITIHLGDKRIKFYLLLLPFLLFATLALSTHFIVIVPTFFILISFYIDKKNWPFSQKQSIILSLSLMAIVAVKMLFSGGSQPYEAAHLYNLTHLSFKDVFNSFTTPVVTTFLYRCLTNYWIPVIVFITGIISLIKNKQTALVWWTIFVCVGYFLLMGLVYADYDSNVALFHIELEWACIGVIIAMPFIFAFLPKVKPHLATGFLVIIFLIRIAYIGSAVPAFTWRTDFTKKVLAQMRAKNIYKVAFYDDDIRHKYILDWALGYESMLESALESDKPMRSFTLFNKDDKKLQAALLSNRTEVFLYNFTNHKDLNKEYFEIDTTQAYEVTTTKDFLRK